MTTHCLSPLRKDQNRRNLVFERQPQWNFSPIHNQPRRGLAHLHGPRQHRAVYFSLRCGPVLDARINLLENARHAYENRGMNFAHVRAGLLEGLAKVHCHAVVQVHVHRLALENM